MMIIAARVLLTFATLLYLLPLLSLFPQSGGLGGPGVELYWPSLVVPLVQFVAWGFAMRGVSLKIRKIFLALLLGAFFYELATPFLHGFVWSYAIGAVGDLLTGAAYVFIWWLAARPWAETRAASPVPDRRRQRLVARVLLTVCTLVLLATLALAGYITLAYTSWAHLDWGLKTGFAAACLYVLAGWVTSWLRLPLLARQICVGIQATLGMTLFIIAVVTQFSNNGWGTVSGVGPTLLAAMTYAFVWWIATEYAPPEPVAIA